MAKRSVMPEETLEPQYEAMVPDITRIAAETYGSARKSEAVSMPDLVGHILDGYRFPAGRQRTLLLKRVCSKLAVRSGERAHARATRKPAAAAKKSARRIQPAEPAGPVQADLFKIR